MIESFLIWVFFSGIVTYTLYDVYKYKVSQKAVRLASKSYVMDFAELQEAELFLKRHWRFIKPMYRDSLIFTLNIRRKKIFGT